MPEPPAWTAEYFSPVELQDLVLHTEVNEFGNWPSITVYFHRNEPPPGR